MKIPFEGTISGAYRFAFSNILSIIGIGWFPFVLLGGIVGGLGYLWLPRIHELIDQLGKAGGHPPADPAQFASMFAPLFGSYFLVLMALFVVQAMVNVGIMRKALGQHPGPVYFFFSLGSQVWRLIGAYFLLTILFYGVVLLLVLAIAALSFLLQKSLPAAQLPVTIVLGIVAFLWVIYAAVRVMFFIPAVVVAENHIGIRRSWHLGRGNFWRIVGILLLIYIPVAFAVSTITSSVLQLFLGPSMGLPTGASSPAEMQAALKAMLNGFMRAAPYYAAIQLVQLILLSGLTAGAVASAYQSVTESAKASPDLKASA